MQRTFDLRDRVRRANALDREIEQRAAFAIGSKKGRIVGARRHFIAPYGLASVQDNAVYGAKQRFLIQRGYNLEIPLARLGIRLARIGSFSIIAK